MSNRLMPRNEHAGDRRDLEAELGAAQRIERDRVLLQVLVDATGGALDLVGQAELEATERLLELVARGLRQAAVRESLVDVTPNRMRLVAPGRLLAQQVHPAGKRRLEHWALRHGGGIRSHHRLDEQPP